MQPTNNIDQKSPSSCGSETNVLKEGIITFMSIFYLQLTFGFLILKLIQLQVLKLISACLFTSYIPAIYE